MSPGRKAMPLLMELYALGVLVAIIDVVALAAVIWRLCKIIKEITDIIVTNDIQKPKG